MTCCMSRQACLLWTCLAAKKMNFPICSYFRRFLRRSKLGLGHNRRRLTILVCIMFATAIIWLHFLLLPAISGAYNDDCYLSESKLNELRHLILTSAKLMDKYNMTYWLDFGKISG